MYTYIHMYINTYIHIYIHTYIYTYIYIYIHICIYSYIHTVFHAYIYTFFDGYCSTVQGLLDWFELDLGFTELSCIQIDLCVYTYGIPCICLYQSVQDFRRSKTPYIPYVYIYTYIYAYIDIYIRYSMYIFIPIRTGFPSIKNPLYVMSMTGIKYIYAYIYIHIQDFMYVYIYISIQDFQR